MNIFIMNFFLYMAWFCFDFKKEKTITLYSSMILLIAFVALAGIYVLQTGIYFDTFGKYSFNMIDVTPFLLTFVTYIVFFQPLKYAKLRNVQIKEFNSPDFKYLAYAWIVLTAAYTILKFVEASAAISIGLDVVYETRHVEGETLSYMIYQNELLLKLRWIGGVVSNTTCPVMMLYSVYCIVNGKSKRMAYLILTLAVLPSFLHSIAIGSRGSMAWSFFKLLFIVILSKKYLPKKLKGSFFVFLLVGLVLVVVYSTVITVARVGDKDAMASVLRYFGEPFPNMVFSYWEKVIIHPMGDRFFPDFFNISNIKGMSPSEIHNYWGNVTGVPILNWKILYCDCYIEFGKLGAFLFVLSISIIFGYYFKIHKLNVYNISILFFYFEMCDSSFTGFNAFSNVILTTFTSILVMNSFIWFLCGQRIYK